MNDASALITGFLFSLSLCFDLGIVNVALMKTGIERGFRPSFLLGFGSCFGDLFYLALALLGVSFVFDIPVVKWTLWIVGTIVLLCLTWKMLRDARRPHSPNTDTAAAAEDSQLHGFYLCSKVKAPSQSRPGGLARNTPMRSM